MRFQQIVDRVAEEVATGSKHSKNDILKVLQKKRDKKQPDFCLYMNQISKTPEQDAEDLSKILIERSPETIRDVICEKTMLTFNINKKLFYKDIFKTIHKKGKLFGQNSIGTGKTVVVDFSSPNIAKKFHVGHLRTTLLGNFVTNLLKACGYTTVAMNYLGDWGKQFGYVLLGYERHGDPEELENDPLIHLFKLYSRVSNEAKNDSGVDEQAREIFRQMEEFQNEKYMKLWRKFRDLSIEKYKKLYSKLNIEFDVYSGESIYNEEAKNFVQNNTLCKQDEDGSYIIDCGSLGNALVQKSDGTTLYMTRDIVAALDRIRTYKADMLVYVVASQQNRHFELLFECLRRIGCDRTVFKHIRYGMIAGMSTRRGNVHFLEDVIETSAEAVKERLLKGSNDEITDMEATAENLAISTLLISDFGAKRDIGYTFDIEKRANCDAGSGAYFQYCHCRLLSIEEKNSNFITDDPDLDLVESDDVMDLAYLLLWYEHVIELCHDDFEPSRLVVYLKDLGKIVNQLVGSLRVKGSGDDLGKARLYVLRASRIVIANALELMGMKPLQRM